MLTALIITLIVVAALGFGLGADRDAAMIFRHPYNNRYNDASAAREDHIDG